MSGSATPAATRPPRLAGGPGLFVAGMVLGLSTLSFFRIPVLPDIGNDLGMSPVEVGAITVAFGLGRLVTDLPAGRLADRLPPSASYLAAGLALAAGSAILASAAGPGVTWAAAFVIGIGSSISNTTGISFFSRIGDRSNRGRYMAIFSTALLGGQSLGPMLGGAIAGLASWRVAQATAAVAAGLASIVCLVLLRRHSRLLGPATAESARRPVAPTAGRTSGVEAPATEIGTIFLIAFSVFFTTGGMTQTLIPLIGGDRMALSASTIGLALGAGGLCRLVGGLIGGYVSDKRSRRAALIPGLLLPAAGVLAVTFWAAPAGWMISIALISVGSIGLSTASAMLGDRIGPAGSGRAFGRFRFVGDLGLISGPLVSTLLYAELGYRAPLLFTAALLLGATLAAALWLPETAGPDR